jgi:hypothetical protein
VRFTRGVGVVVLLIYIFLWVLAFNGVSSLTPLLAVPLVLAVLVALGVWLNRFMGITPRSQRFQDPVDPVDPVVTVSDDRTVPGDSSLEPTSESAQSEKSSESAPVPDPRDEDVEE